MSPAPRAAELQGGSNDADEPLVQLARVGRPQRQWWWGVRSQQGRTGAWCYLCDAFIVTWSSRWPVTATARAAIAAHRTEHVKGRLDTPAAGEIDR